MDAKDVIAQLGDLMGPAREREQARKDYEEARDELKTHREQMEKDIEVLTQKRDEKLAAFNKYKGDKATGVKAIKELLWQKALELAPASIVEPIAQEAEA